MKSDTVSKVSDKNCQAANRDTNQNCSNGARTQSESQSAKDREITVRSVASTVTPQNMTTGSWSPSAHSSPGNVFSRFWSSKSTSEKIIFFLLLFFLLLAILFATLTGIFVDELRKIKHEQSKLCLTKECIASASFILDRMDQKVDPCVDFYDYSCGSYLRTRSVPDDHLSRTILQEIQDQLYIEMKNHLEAPNDHLTLDSIKKAKIFYQSCLSDTSDIEEQAAIHVMIDLIEKGGKWKLLDSLKGDNEIDDGDSESDSRSESEIDSGDKKSKLNQLSARITNAFMLQVQSIFHFFVAPPEKNSTNYALHLFNGNTVLESVYLVNGSQSEEEARELISSYADLIINVMKLLANSSSMDSDTSTSFSSSASFLTLHDNVLKMIAFEADLANLTRMSNDNSSLGGEEESSSSEEIIRRIQNIRISIEELEEEFPFMRWSKIFDLMYQDSKIEIRELLIDSKDYLRELSSLFQKHDLITIDNYLSWATVARFLPYIGPNFKRLYSEFRKNYPDLEDSESSRTFLSKWKECVHLTSDGMKLPISLLYLSHHQSELLSANQSVSEMISEIKIAFRTIVQDQEWILSDVVKKFLIDRADAIGSKIGFPAFLNDPKSADAIYHDLDINQDNLFLLNVIKIAKHEMIIELQKLNQTTDPDRDWLIQPLISNAYFDAINDYIILPAGILRYPLVAPNRPKYLDYSTLGVVIGHEIAHSFDILAHREMEELENVTWFWPSEMHDLYEQRTKCFAEQFSDFTISRINQTLNGNITLDENICDFSGFQQSYRAFKNLKSKSKSTYSSPSLPGLTNYSPEQLFFIQYAQVWCEVSSEDSDRKSVDDNHSPGRFRTRGVVTNSPQFASLFNCPAGSPMNPIHKCDLWTPKS